MPTCCYGPCSEANRAGATARNRCARARTEAPEVDEAALSGSHRGMLVAPMGVSTKFDPAGRVAKELEVPKRGVDAVVRLLAEGGTVPFIARYRKEQTGGLDETQIRGIQERHAYHGELHARRQTILAAIESQGKLTDALRQRIMSCATKTALEDLYLPYRKKRRTRASIARERGLEPLATLILRQPNDGSPRCAAEKFVDPDKDLPDVEAALAGARDIVAEAIADSATVRTLARETFRKQGEITSEAVPDKTGGPTKFEQYYAFRERVTKIPSHRYLAIRRGEREGVLRVRVQVNVDALVQRIESVMGVQPRSPFAKEFRQAIRDAFKRLVVPSVESEVRAELKTQADRAAVDVFADNLRDLLLAAPLGARPVVAIDPGLRTGCKCAALSSTGKYLGSTTIFPAKGAGAAGRAQIDLSAFVERFGPVALAVGNGTGGRETEAFARKLLAEKDRQDVPVVQVNEAGASVYSASELAREEMPDLDVTIRGAVSIGRRLQDPLAELVKIDPKSIGVGQYQHDVHQPMLVRKLGEVVESCVNHVGVDANTASAALLSFVAGIGPKLSKAIVEHREQRGPYKSRRQLLDVAGLGPKAFEQASGFVRIADGEDPLDRSAVHPERYALVERIATDMDVSVAALVGDTELVKKIDIQRYVAGDAGEPTLRDIVAELEKPGRDPRATFEPPKFRDDVNEVSDLKVGMALEAVVTNVTSFGAFVDIGVHQDGLVHVSQLADRFVKDPKEVVRTGDRLKVRVLEVDVARKRIALTAKSEMPAPKSPPEQGKPRDGDKKRKRSRRKKRGASQAATAAEGAESADRPPG